jgi:hypothetical protein
LLRRGERLEALSVGYNVAEGVIAIGAGIAAGSAALSGFGGDSLIEVTSAAVLWWRLRAERLRRVTGREEEIERRASRWAGRCPPGGGDRSKRRGFHGSEPAPSRTGSSSRRFPAVMPFLAREKLKVAAVEERGDVGRRHEQAAAPGWRRPWRCSTRRWGGGGRSRRRRRC